MPKPKLPGIAVAIGKPAEEEEGPGAAEGLEAAMGDLLAAIEAGDTAGMAAAFRHAVVLSNDDE